MQKLKLNIPDGLDFSDLHLTCNSDGTLEFDTEPVLKICRASGINTDVFLESPEENVMAMIMAWYAMHRKLDGAPDPVAENMLGEVAAEDATGQTAVESSTLM